MKYEIVREVVGKISPASFRLRVCQEGSGFFFFFFFFLDSDSDLAQNVASA
jgi:hypothetical protein